MLLAGGAFAAIAMIIPGISGAFLLVAIGLYRTALQSISEFNFPILMPLILGAVLGLFAGAAFVRFLLSKAPKETYGAVLGLVIGSVFVLFPGGFTDGISIIFSVLSFLFGCGLSIFFGRKKIE